MIRFKFEIACPFDEGARVHLFGWNKMAKWLSPYDKAIELYDEVVTTLPRDELAAQSLYRKGMACFPFLFFVLLPTRNLTILNVRLSFIVSFFLLIIFLYGFILYGFILYPNIDALSPTQSANCLTMKLGTKYSHSVSVYRYWIHSIFFITAELWAKVVIFILYWGFANHISPVKEAKPTYTLFIAAGDLGTVVSGPLVIHYISQASVNGLAATLQTVLSYVLFAGMGIIALFWWMNRYVLTDKRYYDSNFMKQDLNQKTRLTLGKSIKHIFTSKYLLTIFDTNIHKWKLGRLSPH